MQEITRKRAIGIGLRARFPLIARYVAIFVLTVGIAFIAVSYYRLRNNTRFVLKPEAPELSKEITGRIDGYKHGVTRDDRLYLLVEASQELIFADGHHELENVRVTVYPPDGNKPDQISSHRAIYDQPNYTISFFGNVLIETKDALKVNTESLSYNQNTEVATTDAPVNFNRENVTGHATGAVVEAKDKKLNLKKDVRITVAPEAVKGPPVKPGSTRSRPVTIRSAQATFEQSTMKLTFSGAVTAEQERNVDRKSVV